MRRNFYGIVILLLVAAANGVVSNAQLIAFPGAEGFGKYSTGGRGGKVVEVTNLNDTGTGSLRWALQQYITTDSVYKDDLNPKYPITIYEPITVVFKVSGIIDLKSDIKINRDNLTIAGQTAPCDGICTKGHSILINGATGGQLFYWGPRRKNVILRYMRFRPGTPLDTNGVPTSSFVTYGLDVENYENAIIDHCSIGWANEECFAIYDNKNTTVQWCIVSEGLYNAYHPKGLRSYGGVWGGQYASYHHNLNTNNVSRTTRFDGSRAHDTTALVDYRNNVIYNWGSSSACYGGEVEIPGGISKINMVNNYYKPGPATSSTLKFVQSYYTAAGLGVWHLSGNIMDGNASMTNDNWLGLDLSKVPAAQQPASKSVTPFDVAVPLPLQPTAEAFDSVLANVGATLPLRDTVDRRIVHEAFTKTATGMGSYGKPGIIDTVGAVGGWPVYRTCDAATDTDHDGMPDEWEVSNGLNPNDPEDRNLTDDKGYTKLEDYLNSIVTSPVVPLMLVSLDAAYNNTGIHLYWNTVNELNTSVFEIEESNDGSIFHKTGFLPAKNNNASNSYQFTDNKSINGVMYYRLKIIDNNGKFKYSNIITINAGLQTGFALFPNPVKNIVNVVFPNAGTKGYVQVKTIDGKIIVTQSIQAGSIQTSVNVSALGKGTYMLTVAGDNYIKTMKFLKQ